VSHVKPAATDAFRFGLAGELAPAAIEMGAAPSGISHPHHHWGGVEQRTKARLALLQCGVCQLALCGVAHDLDQAAR
jgi:hypothetical protein